MELSKNLAMFQKPMYSGWQVADQQRVADQQWPGTPSSHPAKIDWDFRNELKKIQR